MAIADNLREIESKLKGKAALVAVSKYSTNEEIKEAYEAGQRDFGENKAQDLDAKRGELPEDIHWHFIGHLQRNKVKYIAPYISLIHGVDSLRLLKEIDKQGAKADRIIPCLLQVHIAKEESKFGLDEKEVKEILFSGSLGELKNIHIEGLMGMATNTENEDVVKREFQGLRDFFNELKDAELPQNVEMTTLSMGMSNDYEIALECGSNMVRIGSAVFKTD